MPLLSTLAAAQEGLTFAMLSALDGVASDPTALKRLRRVLDTEWSPYLATASAASGSARAYRFYHASLREFFGGAIDKALLTRPEQNFVEELAEATGRAHARIADVFVQRWGGWGAGLPALQKITPPHLDTLDRYGLRHLAAHLEAAGREDELHHLMRLEWGDHQGEQTRARFENTWYTVHERVGDTSGYLSDVDRAWRLTERAYAGRQSSSAIGLQCRYALIVTSLRSLAGNIPPALLAALVEKGIWLGPQGLAYARQMQEPELRSRALAALAPRLAPTERDQALREALEAARAIGDEGSRSRALAALAPHLGPTERDRALREALEAARASGSAGDRSEALAALAPHLTEPLLREALEAARAIESWERRFQSQALAALAPHLGPTERDRALREALEAARAIGKRRSRSQALAALAPHLGPTERDRALREALEAARAIGERGSRSQALAALAPHLGPTERDRALREALEAARASESEGSRSEALAALAPRLAELGHPAEALEAARASGDEWSRSRALAALAPHLTEPLLREALEAARAIGSGGPGPGRWLRWLRAWRS